MLHATALLGRTFVPEADQPGNERVLVLSHRMWQTHFNSDPQVVGRQVELDLKKHTIVGVMPKDFSFPAGIEFLGAARARSARETHSRRSLGFWLGAHAPGSLGRSGASRKWMLANRLGAAYPDTNHGWGVKMMASAPSISKRLPASPRLSWPLRCLRVMFRRAALRV